MHSEAEPSREAGEFEKIQRINMVATQHPHRMPLKKWER
jgi:hypothetical protein